MLQQIGIEELYILFYKYYPAGLMLFMTLLVWFYVFHQLIIRFIYVTSFCSIFIVFMALMISIEDKDTIKGNVYFN